MAASVTCLYCKATSPKGEFFLTALEEVIYQLYVEEDGIRAREIGHEGAAKRTISCQSCAKSFDAPDDLEIEDYV